MKDKLKIALKILFMPRIWSQLEPYSEAWDIKFNELMDKHKFIYVDEYSAKLGNYEIWISNYPYCTFYPWKPITKTRAKRSTILRAKEKLLKDIFNPL